MPPPPPHPERLHALDNLRATMMWLGIGVSSFSVQ